MITKKTTKRVQSSTHEITFHLYSKYTTHKRAIALLVLLYIVNTQLFEQDHIQYSPINVRFAS